MSPHSASSSVYSAEVPRSSILFDGPKQDLELTVMLCGFHGTGKSSFVEAFCAPYPCSRNTLDSVPRNRHNSKAARDRGLSFETQFAKIKRTPGITLGLKVVNVLGFGAQMDSSQDPALVREYLMLQFEEYLGEETKIDRDMSFDNRVHLLLYFVDPTFGKLRDTDIELMKAVHDTVNLVPVVARAETLTSSEMMALKHQVREQLAELGISAYPLTDGGMGDETYHNTPFSVMSSTELYDFDGCICRGRDYPWGFVDLEDPYVNDLNILRRLILDKHLQSLRNTTFRVLYERYRSNRLKEQAASFSAGHTIPVSSLLPTVPRVRQTHVQLSRQSDRLTALRFDYSSFVSPGTAITSDSFQLI